MNVTPDIGVGGSASDTNDQLFGLLTPVTGGDEAESVARHRRGELEAKGVVFTDMDTARRDHPEIVAAYAGKIVRPIASDLAIGGPSDWSAGWFVYVPPGVEADISLPADLSIDAETHRFERTLIIADEGSRLHYLEGCLAPVYTSDSLRLASVEIVVRPSATVRYTSLRNRSSNVVELVAKGAYVEEEGHIEWIDGIAGGRLTMQHPVVWLAGPQAGGDVLSVVHTTQGQHHDTGARFVHLAPETSSKLVSKSISHGGGRSVGRSLVLVDEGAHGCTSHLQSDALILDVESAPEWAPQWKIDAPDARCGHTSTVAKFTDEQMFYLASRGLSRTQAIGVVANGFVEPIIRTLPMEYAVEWTRMIERAIEGSE